MMQHPVGGAAWLVKPWFSAGPHPQVSGSIPVGARKILFSALLDDSRSRSWRRDLIGYRWPAPISRFQRRFQPALVRLIATLNPDPRFKNSAPNGKISRRRISA